VLYCIHKPNKTKTKYVVGYIDTKQRTGKPFVIYLHFICKNIINATKKVVKKMKIAFSVVLGMLATFVAIAGSLLVFDRVIYRMYAMVRDSDCRYLYEFGVKESLYKKFEGKGTDK